MIEAAEVSDIKRRIHQLEGRFPQNSITSVSERHVHAGGDVLQARATSALTLSTTPTSIVGDGDSSKVRLLLNIGTWSIIGTVDFTQTVADPDNLIGELYVNDSGTPETGTAVLASDAAVHRATVSQTWRVVITADNTPVELKASKSTAAGTAAANLTHTALTAVRATRGHGGASGSGGVTDHGALTGLSDDDHSSLYLLTSGARAGSTSQAQSFGATGIKADVIAESTAAAGVTVDGLLIKDGDASVFALLAGRAGSQDLAGSTLTGETLTLRANAVDATGILVLRGSGVEAALTGDFSVSGVSAFAGIAPTSTVRVRIGGTVTQSASLWQIESNLAFTLSAACSSVIHFQTAGTGVSLGGFTLTNFSGLDTRLDVIGAGTVTQLFGNQVTLKYYTTPIVTTAVGCLLQVGGVGGPHASSGTIYGYRVDDIGHASWDNVYAVYIADQTAGTATFSIYQTGTTGLNVFNANTRIGGLDAPTVALDVTGAIIASSTLTVGANAQVLVSPAAGVMSCGADFRVVGNDIENSAGTKQITFATSNNTVRVNDRLGVNATPLAGQRAIISTFPESGASETILTIALTDTLTTNRTARSGFIFTSTIIAGVYNLTTVTGISSLPVVSLEDDGVDTSTLTAYRAIFAGISISSSAIIGVGTTVTRADAISVGAPGLGLNAFGSFPT